MTGGRAKRRRKQKWRHAARFQPLSVCLNCGEPGPHFVPPSFGDKGFFICKPKETA